MSVSVKSRVIQFPPPSESHEAELNKWNNSFQYERFISLRSDIIWRLPLLYLLFGVSLGFIISYQPKIGTIHTYFIMCGIAFILCMQLLMNRVRNILQLYDVLYLICGMTAILPLGFLVSWRFDYFFLLLIFFAQAMCWMLFPWSLQKSLGWAIFLFSYWTIILNLKQFSLFNFLPLFIVLVIAVVISRLRFQELSLYQASLFLTKLCSITQNSFSLCIQLCKLILSTYDTERALIVLPGGDVFRIDQKTSNRCYNSNLSAQSLYINLKDKNTASGAIKIEKSDLALQAFVFDCLSAKISNFKYYFVQTAYQNKELEVLLLIPGVSFLDSLRMPRLYSGIKSLFDIYTISLFTFRNQAMSNDTVLAYGTAVADREEDINQLVHTVNNKAQEITIHCDIIRQAITEAETANDISIIPEISENTALIEDNVKLLTQNVSDIKLIREIATLRTSPRIEKVSLKNAFDEIQFYAVKCSSAKNLRTSIENNFNSEADGVLVPSSDYFETVLRMLLNSAFSRSNKGDKVSFSTTKSGSQVVIELKDNGVEKPTADSLIAVQRFCHFSDGQLEIMSSEGEFRNLIRITLPYCEFREVKTFTAGNWLLFVDDNEQIITFYSRIAEALGMDYMTAGTCEDAVGIIKSKGRPRLVITDIQLTNSSGLDIVIYLRKTYDKDLPVIVVSGNDDADVSAKAYQAGASKYLKKPLGRKKLFSEIEVLLQ